MRQQDHNGRFVTNDPKTAFDEKWSIDTVNGCWIWRQSASRKHYGNFCSKALGFEQISAHRASWLIHNGEIPDGLLVLHKCDNELCVNPDHLWLGTNSDNQKDAYRKGRKKGYRVPMPGISNPAAKLDEGKVREMRQLREAGWTIKQLSSKFSISGAVAHKVVRRELWRHVA